MDAVYYLNLAHRPDRRAWTEAELAALGWRGRRIEAVSTPERGALGCALSHAAALATFLADPAARHALVLEDDIAFTRDPRPDLERFLHAHPSPDDWDVLMLASNTVLEEPHPALPFLTRILDAQTTSAYAVSRPFALTLYRAFLASASLLAEGLRPEHCCDMRWKQLQPESRWFCLSPKAALQRPDYSDIERRNVHYGV